MCVCTKKQSHYILAPSPNNIYLTRRVTFVHIFVNRKEKHTLVQLYISTYSQKLRMDCSSSSNSSFDEKMSSEEELARLCAEQQEEDPVETKEPFGHDNQAYEPSNRAFKESLQGQTRQVKNGLTALKSEHVRILDNIKQDGTGLIDDRIANVTKSLENLDLGIEESTVLLSLSEHFDRLELERMKLRLEMERVHDENDWLREELSDTQSQLQSALAELTELREEKSKWQFEENLKRSVSESSLRPITPSKIPVGSWRVEEEKDINRAMNSDCLSTRSASPACNSVSRIPVIRHFGSQLPAYKKLMEREAAKTKAKKENQNQIGGKRNYFKLNATNNTKSRIPIR